MQPNPIVKLLPPLDNALLAVALGQTTDVWVEAGTESFLPEIDGQIILILTTNTAFATDPGTLFTDMLIKRKLLGSHRRDDLRLALHEALANAVVHGNLELPSNSSLSPSSFLTFSTLLQQRLQSPDYGQRPLALAARTNGSMLDITLRDSGAGFLIDGGHLVPQGRLSGHGLRLMAQHSDGLRHEDNGRSVILSYQADSEAAQHD